MNKFILIIILLITCELALGAEIPTPTVPKVLANTPMNRLAIRLRQQNIQIQRDEKAGKLTKAQAKALKAHVTKGPGLHFTS